MHIIKAVSAPNGAITTIHRVSKLEVSDNTVLAIVNSYVDTSATLIAWQENYQLPLLSLGSINNDSLFGFLSWLTKNHEVFDGGTVIPDGEETLDIARLTKWGMVKDLKSRYLKEGLTIKELGRFDVDDNGRKNIDTMAISALTAQLTNNPWSATWTLADNQEVVLDSSNMIAVQQLVSNFVNSLHQHSQVLRKEIFEDSSTVEEVEQIDIENGWISETPIVSG